MNQATTTPTEPTTITLNATVALQQSQPDLLPFDNQYACLTDEELHRKVIAATQQFQLCCFEVARHAEAALRRRLVILIPLCEEAVERYKMLGVAARDRAYGQPTVEQYFASIKLNHNTVRSWFYRYPELLRKQLLKAPFTPDKPTRLPRKRPNLRQTLKDVLTWFQYTEPYRRDPRLVVSTELLTSLRTLLKEEEK